MTKILAFFLSATTATLVSIFLYYAFEEVMTDIYCAGNIYPLISFIEDLFREKQPLPECNTGEICVGEYLIDEHFGCVGDGLQMFHQIISAVITIFSFVLVSKPVKKFVNVK